MFTAKVTLELTQNFQHDLAYLVGELDGVPIEEVMEYRPHQLLTRVDEVKEEMDKREELTVAGDEWLCGGYTIKRPRWKDIDIAELKDSRAVMNMVKNLAGLSEEQVQDMPLKVYLPVVRAVTEDTLGAYTFREPLQGNAGVLEDTRVA